MKIIKSRNYKIAGKKERKKRDGTGPFEDSFQNKKFPKGKKQMKDEECSFVEDKKKKDTDNA